jgi:hypothetical protein
VGLDDIQVNLRECNYLDAESWEGQLNNDRTSNEKAPELGPGKKPYKTPTLRFESVFEVSALACGKITPSQSGCGFVQKAS